MGVGKGGGLRRTVGFILKNVEMLVKHNENIVAIKVSLVDSNLFAVACLQPCKLLSMQLQLLQCCHI